MSRFRGSIDCPLNEAGWVAAIKAGFTLRHAPIRLIVHDYQQRTLNTAKCIQLFHETAVLAQHEVHSQRMGWLEGEEVTSTTLDCMRYYIRNPDVIPGPGYYSEKAPQSFKNWLYEWFWVYDNVKRRAEQEHEHTVIVTHNRNIMAVLSREGDWIDEAKFDAPGPRSCEIVQVGQFTTLVRHGDTDFGT